MNLTADAATLTTFVGAAETLVDEAKLHVTPDGVTVTAVDAANVGMVDESLPADAFDTYAVDDGITLGVDIERLADILTLSDEPWDLSDVDRKILLESDGLEYTLATIDPNSIREEPDIPDLDLPAEVTLEGRQLDRVITAADMVSDHIRLGVDEAAGEFYAKARGDTDDVDVDFDADQLVSLTAADAESLFSLDYLKDFNRAIPSKAEVTLELGEELPTKMHWADNGVSVTYMLAPRIQGD